MSMLKNITAIKTKASKQGAGNTWLKPGLTAFFLFLSLTSFQVPFVLAISTGTGGEEFPLGSDVDDDFRVGTTKLVTEGNSGNVGVGTFNPSGTVEVIKQSTNILFMVSSKATGDGDYMIVSSSGNVGIGTTAAPASKLVVVGNIVATGNAGVFADAIATTGTVPTVSGMTFGFEQNASSVIRTTGSGGFAGGYVYDDGAGGSSSIESTNNGAIALGYAEGYGTAGITSDIRASNTGAIAMGFTQAFNTDSSIAASGVGAIALGYAVDYNITSSGSGSFAMGIAQAVDITSSGVASFAMGEDVQATANNAYALGKTIKNGIAQAFMVGFDAASYPFTVLTTNVGIGTIGPSGRLEIIKSGSGHPFMVSANATADGNLFVVTSGGNVGIGTTAPVAYLSVGVAAGPVGGIPSDLRLWVEGTNSGQLRNRIQLGGNNNVDYGSYMRDDFYLAASYQTLTLGTRHNGTDYDALYATAGNVGIGTWDPGGAFEIAKKSGIKQFMVSSNATADGDYFTVLSGGNVGIGNAAPAVKLEVEGVTESDNFRTETAVASGTNAVAFGQDVQNTGTITASGAGSMAVGYINDDVGGGGTSANITASNSGSVAMGYSYVTTNGDDATSIVSSGLGSIAMGASYLDVDGVSSNITASGTGSIAMGSAYSENGLSLLTATSFGSVAMGLAVDGGTMTSSGSGSVAMGISTGTLSATGTGSVALGQNVQATGNNAFALGTTLVNSTASTFKVGFAALPTMTITSANVGIGTITPQAVFIVTPPAAEAIAGAATITANACGTIKRITSVGAVTTNTTNTFTAPTTAYTGCCMDVINVDTADAITLDFNANFKSAGGADVVLGINDSARVCSDGVVWYQVGATGNN